MQLVIANNSATTNPFSVDLSSYVHVNDDAMDPASPSFTDKVISHSLLKEGGFLALTDLKTKELVFPLLLMAANMSATIQLLSTINQILESPGATCQWQDDNLSQPTYFDLAGGQFDVAYNYRKGQQAYTEGKLRLFAEPFGRTAQPRPYAVASGVGPLLMISPYASGGALAIGASTQDGVAGYGGAPAGPSSGVFYWGAPSLTGDAPALLQVNYGGPSSYAGLDSFSSPIYPTGFVAVSLLPDGNYQPLADVSQIFGYGASRIDGRALHGAYFGGSPNSNYFGTGDVSFALSLPMLGNPAPATWAGQHRLFAIARASSATSSGTAQIARVPDASLTGASAVYSVPLYTDWRPVDLGTLGVHASEAAFNTSTVNLIATTASATLDITGFVVLPDSSTWFMPGGSNLYPDLPAFGYNNLLIDDTIAQQFATGNGWIDPLPAFGVVGGLSGNLFNFAPVTQYSRGLVPRPDPKNGLPILAIMAIGGGSPPNPVNQQTFAYVSVLERARYVLP